jgi:hypothetical protein
MNRKHIRNCSELLKCNIVIGAFVISLLSHNLVNTAVAMTTDATTTTKATQFSKFYVPSSCFVGHICLPTDIIWTGSHFIISTVPGVPLKIVSRTGTVSSPFAANCFASGEESYMSIAQPQNYKFGIGNIYIAKGGIIWKIDPTDKQCSIFTNITGPFVGVRHGQLSHTGLTFDTEGSFDNSLMASTDDGSIWKIDYRGNFKLLGSNIGGRPECIHVVPKNFGPYGGNLIVGSEKTGSVYAVTNDGKISSFLSYKPGLEHCGFLPRQINLTDPFSGLYVMAANNEPDGGNSMIFKIPSSKLVPYAGSLILADEYSTRNIIAVTYNRHISQYILQPIISEVSIGPNVTTALEGFVFVNNVTESSS